MGSCGFSEQAWITPGSNSFTLAFQHVSQVRERPMRLATGRRMLCRCMLGRTALTILVQRHDRQHQQQLLGQQLHDADSSAGRKHCLALERDASSLRLRADQGEAALGLEHSLHRLQTALTLEADHAVEAQISDRYTLLTG